MRPAWRLATSNLSGRRSHAALLCAAVALSAALITAVAAAMRSLNASVGDRTRATLGTADLRVEPTGSGQTIPESLLARVRAWEEVEFAAPRLSTPLPSLVVRKPILVPDDAGGFVLEERTLSTGAMAQGGESALELRVRPRRLLAGREAIRDGEIVLDALLLERLGWAWQTKPDRQYGFGVATRSAVRERLKPLDMPEAVRGEREAERLNFAQGVRIGDDVRIIPRLVSVGSPIHLALAILGPNRMVNIVRLFGGSEGIANIAATMFDPRTLRVQVEFLRNPARLRVVGVAEQPPLGGRPQCYLDIGTLQRLTDQPGRISQIDVVLRDGFLPEDVALRRRTDLGEGVILQTTERITSGLEKNIKSSQLGFILASVLAFLSAAFIIMTGMTTDIARRQRELAVLRCIGASRGQVARAQLVIGLLVGLIGAAAGVPLGLLVAFGVARRFPEQLPSGLVVPPIAIVGAVVGAVGSGLAGSALPAWQASRMSPLRAMASRSTPARGRGIAIVTGAGLLCALVHLAIITLLPVGMASFWAYIGVGLPALFVGYFLLSVPATVLAARVAAPVLSRVLGLPRRVLSRGVSAVPYRYGFTAGAMMTGLALMVAIWTNGRAVLRDWIDVMEFPDAFASGLPLRDGAKRVLDDLPFVADSCAITREIVQVAPDAAMGIRQLQRYDTSFIGFEPEPFLRMTNLTWVQGDPDEAMRRLEAPPREGFDGAVLIAREFLTARGKGVGDTFVCERNDRTYRFEIVGVVTSPGLDIASRFFNIGEEYTHQAVHAVFGSMKDLRRNFGSDKTHIIQIDLAAGVDDALAVEEIRRALTPYGLLDVGSGRQVKARIHQFATSTLLVFSAVAVVAMLVACFGVANLIIAAIETRSFEFGVLRAVGAQRGLLVRLVLGEAAIIAIVASIVGTVMGIQAAFGGRRMYEILLGIQFSIRPPWSPIVVGWGVVLMLTLLAAGPAVWRLNRRHPRELLATTA
ncbi:MAG: FtsX-like permease family protein [Phycisphaeraceae bacterium]|nr:FtsX-like permease family protein [Phycisphaeraceae bacterium]